MTADPVRAIADAVLYEGYVLWPYRRSAMKNRQRWTFGGVHPRAHSQEHEDDRWQVCTECLLEGDAQVDVRARFLQVVRRQVERDGQPVDRVEVGGELHLSWEEAAEREFGPGPIRVPAGRERERLGDGAEVVRSWHALDGIVEVGSEELRPGLHRVTVAVANETPWSGGTRERALERTFCSLHVVLRADGGSFVSQADPPDELRDASASCLNAGLWPVLVGEPGDRSTVLASPIILEDHPRIAPESPGDLFDGGEIDQLLVLNILSLTDDEKAEVRATDPRVREILERTEALSPEQLMQLHGTIREPR